jgi:hypothetical protein
MSPKSVNFNANPRNKPTPSAQALDAFVQGKTDSVEPLALAEKRPLKRLTFDIDADLHKRIRLACLQKGEDMAVELRKILEHHFPE